MCEGAAGQATPQSLLGCMQGPLPQPSGEFQCLPPADTELLAQKGLGSRVGFPSGLAKLKRDSGYNSTSTPHTENLLAGIHGEGLKAVLFPPASQETTKDHEHPALSL